MLDGAGDQMLPAGRLEGLGHASNGEVVALGPAAGEHDLAGIRANQRGHRAAGLVDDRLGPLPEMVDAGRVAELLPQRRGHAVDDGAGGGSRGVMVEVDPHGWRC